MTDNTNNNVEHMSEAHRHNQSRQALAQSLLARHDKVEREHLEAERVAQQKQIGLRGPLSSLPDDILLQVFSFVDKRDLLRSCALVSHSWLHLIYQLTGKSLSIAGACSCQDCQGPRALEDASMEGLIRHIAKRAGSLQSLTLDCKILLQSRRERLWYVLSGCRELTALSLLGDHRVSDVLPPDTWDLLPHGLTSVRIQGRHSSLGFLFLLDDLRELDLAGKSFAALLNGCDEKGHEFLHKLQALTLTDDLQDLSFPAPEMLGSLTKLCLDTRNLFLVKGRSSSCLSFILGLTKLRNLRLKLISSGDHRRIQLGDLSQLQQHSSLQEVHLLGLAERGWKQFSVGVGINLTKEACSFLAMQQVKLLSLAYVERVKEVFPSVDFSASGLQKVALVFERAIRKMDISNLLNAPLLEFVELEVPLISELKLSAEINMQRHDKPFHFIVVQSEDDETYEMWPKPLAWEALEEAFGPQDYKPSKLSFYEGFWIHQTLLKDVQWGHPLQIYCNAARTRALEAERWNGRRQALAIRACDYQVHASRHLCEDCEEDRMQDRPAWMASG